MITFKHLWLSHEHGTMVGRVVLQPEKCFGMVYQRNVLAWFSQLNMLFHLFVK